MKPAERHAWIIDYLHTHPDVPVDCLDTEFVDAYIAATGASYIPMPFGAHRCAMVGRDLGAMARSGELERQRVGISGSEHRMTWVWAYELPDERSVR